ncbi:2'-5' RNA ligase family protein [Streptomyces sp. 2314.4]|uniref:2'-5' RNA ligase family protein n=1 Tax=Streptomyces sp. 2314.4 TaxID=1881025 RepID=UPI001C40B35F|nr:2'-5' RNA ligase family protein [Streptomyces sp. 2314.4]
MSKPAGATRSAIIAPVSDAEAAVGPYRRVLDHTVSWPVPAHVTVLYPFVAPDRITQRVIDDVRACLLAVPAFTVTFSRVAWFGQDVMWLAPNPDAPFRRLTEVMWNHFPECPPYRGAHPDPTPHLTVGSSHLADTTTMRRASANLQAELPIHARIDRVHLIVGADTPGSWGTVSEFALLPA